MKYSKLSYYVLPLHDSKTVPFEFNHIVVDVEVIEGALGAGGYTADDEKRSIEELSLMYNALVKSGLIDIYCATVVSGENEPSVYIYPCLHILCKLPDSVNEQVIVDLLNDVCKGCN